MKKFLCWMLALCLCLSLTTLAFADDDPPLAPDLSLHGNPTTGYQWTYTVDDPQVLTVTDCGYTSDNEALMGSGGVFSYRLDGLMEGSAVVTFTYAKSADEIVCVLTYHVTVDDDHEVEIYGQDVQLS
ncbi:MAG: protease inhibitor I42 family protein [Eubacteriales bacterium]|nr:protease inhibitor I42 family protein [Eubacteriales bacterium]